ncbi:MAG: TIGR01212 family radical SAM protein [Gammaproteobacteria bacterium RBG_16_57_12]|nr:MAG: TIGR01212 family radical SAM protein [Gammaproteobacteria bacterium RBG_16_57_12]
MTLAHYIHTFGQAMLKRHGERIHKVSINAGLTCPNRDGSKGRGGCTFCNNVSFSPNGRQTPSIAEQIAAGQKVILKRTRARKYIAYFQSYTNTYTDLASLRQLYDQAIRAPGVVGLSIGTRPDCVPDAVLDLLVQYRQQGLEVWLELGLQSAFDETLRRINRCSDFADYRQAVTKARALGIPVCTHLIIGLPGETRRHNIETLEQVLALGTDGLKLHPLHVVKGTALANEWRRGEYTPLALDEYVSIVADLIGMAPPDMIYHRLTGTASADILLAPAWCEKKWLVLNSIEAELRRRSHFSGISPAGRLPDQAA